MNPSHTFLKARFSIDSLNGKRAFVPMLISLMFCAQLFAQTTFTEIPEGPIVNDNTRSQGAVWFDADNDGHLDLFVANTGVSDSDTGHLLYMNNRDRAFIRITSGDLVNESY